jgi:uncharacterized protein involved in exopolysaccharide biosynthesis
MLDSTRDEGIDLRQLVTRLWRGWRWVIGSTLVCGVTLTIVAFVRMPMYTATIVVVPVSAEGEALDGGAGSALGQLSGIASLAGINIGSHAPGIEEALAILKSRQFTESFIDRYHLLRVLFHKDWDDRENTWRPGTVPHTLTGGYLYFDRTIRAIGRDKKTGLVTIQITWENREQAAEWANNLVEQLNAEMRTRATEESNASLAYLEKELDSTTVVATREAINRLIEAQVKKRMLANVTKQYALRVVEKALLPDPKADRAGPGKATLIAAGLFGGFLIGSGIVLIRASLAPRLRGVTDSSLT